MLQGTGSDVGKSVLVAGFCRAFVRRGLKVMPFKPQNMSNNAAVTAEGGEIGRAQALQAVAARVSPHTDMNPVLLKPQGDMTCQLVVQGHRRGIFSAADSAHGQRQNLLADVLSSFQRLKRKSDIVVVEGAGSPAEINLREGDIANMGFACAANVPVILTGDIDRGGVIASLVGTKAVLSPEDGKRICGFIINKFRGNPDLFESGYRSIEQLTGWRGLGVLPWLGAARLLPAEDAMVLEKNCAGPSAFKRVACPVLPHIANFDDLDPLMAEPGIELVMVPPGQPIPRDVELIILPGSKATLADMIFLRDQGWDIDILAHVRQGGYVLGICGGYQMLGQRIADPYGLEGSAGSMAGLGLLDMETELSGEKTLARVCGIALGASFEGYEIHAGKERQRALLRPFATLRDGRREGAISSNGRIMGTYCHGLLASAALRSALLAKIGVVSNRLEHDRVVDGALDDIACAIERHINLDLVLEMARQYSRH